MHAVVCEQWQRQQLCESDEVVERRPERRGAGVVGKDVAARRAVKGERAEEAHQRVDAEGEAVGDAGDLVHEPGWRGRQRVEERQHVEVALVREVHHAERVQQAAAAGWRQRHRVVEQLRDTRARQPRVAAEHVAHEDGHECGGGERDGREPLDAAHARDERREEEAGQHHARGARALQPRLLGGRPGCSPMHRRL
eukprot:scaffold107580_cov66-Phaeocystis_antarctica.AAC.11